MIRAGSPLIAASLVLLSGPANAQRHQPRTIRVPNFRLICPPDVDRYADWVQSRPGTPQQISPIAKAAIHEVGAARRAQAVEMLEKAEIVPLGLDQAKDLVGDIPEAAAAEGQPYLIRNVVPSFVSSLGGPASLLRVGSALWIRAALIGCGGFFKNPLVVFLPFTPTRVDIQAVATW